MPKFSAASGLAVVTRFHPARPLLRWSSEANLRAMMYGCSNVVDAVAISPSRSVTTASAGSSVSGSNEVTVALRFSASTGMFSTARWSAMKKASNLPRSSVWANRLRWAKLKFASGQPPG